MPKSRMPTLHIVDGSGYIFRAYWAIRSLTNSAGDPTNAVYGFANMLQKVMDQERPSHMALVFDADGPTFRHDLHPAYKSSRPPPPEDLSIQIPEIEAVVDAFRIRRFAVPRVEADDVVATLVRQALQEGFDVRLISGDKDLMQLVQPGVGFYEPMRGETFDRAGVERKLGVPPEQVRDALALAGDSTDDVPGVKGVGLKTAAKLLASHGDLEGVLAAARQGEVKGKTGKTLAESSEDARLSQTLVTLKDDVDLGLESLDALAYPGPDRDRIVALYRRLEFDRLLGRWESNGEAPAPTEVEPQREFATEGHRAVGSEAELDALVEEAAGRARIGVSVELEPLRALDGSLLGITLMLDAGHGHHVPLAPAKGGLDPNRVLEALRPVFEAPSVAKVGGNLKLVLGALRSRGIEVDGLEFDATLAGYLLDPDHPQADAEGLARHHFGTSIARRADALKSGRKRRSFGDLEPDRAAALAGQALDVAFHAREVLPPLLKQAGVWSVLEDLEMPLIPVLESMERHGIRIDVDRLGAMAADFEAELERLEAACYEAAGTPFNIGSPKQLEKILFEDLELKIVKRTPTGRPSTDHSVLEALADAHPLPQTIVDYRQVEKLKSTYVDALPKLVNPETGRVHTVFNQAMAATGRLSSNEPNLQNIPIRSELGRQLRTVFVAEEGFEFVSVDYSQVELRVLAHLCKDEVLVQAFMDHADVHTRTASVLFEVDPEEVTRQMRSQAKAVNFGVLYGMGPVRLSRELKIPRKVASKFVQDYFERQPGVKRYIDETLEEARKTKEVRTILGRRRLVPDLDVKNRAARSAAERVATNTPIQGSAADLIKLAMLRVDALLRDRFPDARLLLQVHDELLVEAPKDEAAQVAEEVKAQMERVMPLDVPLVAEAHVGRTWDEAH